MIEKVFVDSNVLVYAHNADSGDKQRIAANAIADILDARSGVLSIRDIARDLLRGYSSWAIQPLTAENVVAASFIERNHQLCFWMRLSFKLLCSQATRSCFPKTCKTGDSSVESRSRIPCI